MKYIFFIIITAFLYIPGCDQETERRMPTAKDSDQSLTQGSVQEAVAVLSPTEGNNVSGTVTFTKSGNSVRVTAHIEGLKPGDHGFHIHEKGDCSAPDASSAGGHFNPHRRMHGAPTDSARHVGDLGNITADQSGKAHLEFLDSLLTFEGENSILGKAVIVHIKKDDFKTQPTGDAGSRLACGVIEEK